VPAGVFKSGRSSTSEKQSETESGDGRRAGRGIQTQVRLGGQTPEGERGQIQPPFEEDDSLIDEERSPITYYQDFSDRCNLPHDPGFYSLCNLLAAGSWRDELPDTDDYADFYRALISTHATMTVTHLKKHRVRSDTKLEVFRKTVTGCTIWGM
jgi:hypothetical protein